MSILLVASIVAWLAAASNVLAQKNDEEARKIAAYPITIDLFNRYAQVSLNLARVPKNDPSYRQMSGEAFLDMSLDDRVKHLEAAPKVMAVLQAHGISARDYIMTAAVYAAVLLVKMSMQTGAGQNGANKLEWEASAPGHVKFYDSHKAEMQKYQDDLMHLIVH
jgi:hypothetical protein